ncbi:MAG: hypothetical protein ACLFQB_11030 [Chitinispirillaceae bacterium]
MKPILKWQYEQIVKELLLLQDHVTDRACPCQSEGERCIRKHLLSIEAYAEETTPIETDQNWRNKLLSLAQDAKEKRSGQEKVLCDKGKPPELIEWSRNWRKVFEEYSLACENRRNESEK